jgi:hypothetical protein
VANVVLRGWVTQYHDPNLGGIFRYYDPLLRDPDAEAHKRAYNTLCRFLSPQQKADLDLHRGFDLIGSDGEKYHLKATYGGNITGESFSVPLCVAFGTYRSRPPVYDLLLIEKLWLEHNAPELFDVIRHPIVNL